jgi:RNA polymerase I-specific transcription initiation factor RRN6
MGSTGSPTASRGWFLLSVDDWNTENLEIQTIKFTPAPLMADSAPVTGQESKYIDYNVKFYQIWAVSSNLSLNSTLSAIYDTSLKGDELTITAPTWKVSKTANLNKNRGFGATFVAADGEVDGELESSTSRIAPVSSLAMTEIQQGLHWRLNWRNVFQHIFSGNDVFCTSQAKTVKTIMDLIMVVNNRLDQGKQEDCLPISSL